MPVISYAGTLGYTSALTDRTRSGSGEEASYLDREVAKLLKHYSAPRMEVLIPEIEALVTEPEAMKTAGAPITPIDEDTARAAIAFAMLLPRSAPVPEIAPDSDGEICFDWLGSKRRIFSVSINKAGCLAYAGRYSEKSKIHGTEQLAEECPPEIARGIERATQ